MIQELEDITSPETLYILDTNCIYRRFVAQDLTFSSLTMDYIPDPAKTAAIMNEQIIYCNWLQNISRNKRLVVLNEVSEEIKGLIGCLNKAEKIGLMKLQKGADFRNGLYDLFQQTLLVKDSINCAYIESFGADPRRNNVILPCIDEYSSDYRCISARIEGIFDRINEGKRKKWDTDSILRKRRVLKTDLHIVLNSYFLNVDHNRDVCILTRDSDILNLFSGIDDDIEINKFNNSNRAKLVSSSNGLSVICYNL